MLSIGDKIKKLRLSRGWLQKELASRTQFTAQKISNIERGFTSEISSDDIGVFAKAFDVSTDSLLLGDNAISTIKDALYGDEELLLFFNQLSKRDDLRLLFSQTKDLSADTIKRIIRYIQIVEIEEADE